MHLDQIIGQFKDKLERDFPNHKKYINEISTKIKKDLSYLGKEDILKIQNHSPVNLSDRIQELGRFDKLMHTVNKHSKNITGNQMACIITYRNYMMFVYLKDNCFEITKSLVKDGSLTKKICKKLTSEKIRSFRNAIAHGNFRLADRETIEFHASKSSKIANTMTKFIVTNDELQYWQELARITAYTIYGYILKKNKNL